MDASYRQYQNSNRVLIILRCQIQHNPRWPSNKGLGRFDFYQTYRKEFMNLALASGESACSGKKTTLACGGVHAWRRTCLPWEEHSSNIRRRACMPWRKPALKKACLEESLPALGRRQLQHLEECLPGREPACPGKNTALASGGEPACPGEKTTLASVGVSALCGSICPCGYSFAGLIHS